MKESPQERGRKLKPSQFYLDLIALKESPQERGRKLKPPCHLTACRAAIERKSPRKGTKTTVIMILSLQKHNKLKESPQERGRKQFTCYGIIGKAISSIERKSPRKGTKTIFCHRYYNVDPFILKESPQERGRKRLYRLRSQYQGSPQLKESPQERGRKPFFKSPHSIRHPIERKSPRKGTKTGDSLVPFFIYHGY